MPRRKVEKPVKEDNIDDNINDDTDNVMDEINQQLTEADEYVAKKLKKDENATVDSSEVPDLLTDEIISHHDDESIDDDMADEIDEEAKKSFLENEVFDAIVKYMKTDDLIREKDNEHREMMNPLKKDRTVLETFLIDYLEQIDQEFIKIGEKTQLTKVETESKGAIKPENVAEALVEGFKKHEFYTEEQHEEMLRVVKDMMVIVESKRERKISKKIRRVDLEKEAKKNAAKESKQKKMDEASRISKADQKLEKLTKTQGTKGSAKNVTTKATKATKNPRVSKAKKH